MAWLWQELERRLSPEEYEELRAEWLRRYRERGKRIRGTHKDAQRATIGAVEP
jgi:hypothetical protein